MAMREIGVKGSVQAIFALVAVAVGTLACLRGVVFFGSAPRTQRCSREFTVPGLDSMYDTFTLRRLVGSPHEAPSCAWLLDNLHLTEPMLVFVMIFAVLNGLLALAVPIFVCRHRISVKRFLALESHMGKQAVKIVPEGCSHRRDKSPKQLNPYEKRSCISTAIRSVDVDGKFGHVALGLKAALEILLLLLAFSEWTQVYALDDPDSERPVTVIIFFSVICTKMVAQGSLLAFRKDTTTFSFVLLVTDMIFDTAVLIVQTGEVILLFEEANVWFTPLRLTATLLPLPSLLVDNLQVLRGVFPKIKPEMLIGSETRYQGLITSHKKSTPRSVDAMLRIFGVLMLLAGAVAFPVYFVVARARSIDICNSSGSLTSSIDACRGGRVLFPFGIFSGSGCACVEIFMCGRNTEELHRRGLTLADISCKSHHFEKPSTPSNHLLQGWKFRDNSHIVDLSASSAVWGQIEEMRFSLKRLFILNHQWKEPPAFLAKMVKLGHLGIIAGPLENIPPGTFDNMPNLAAIVLDHNDIRGNLPSAVDELTQLRLVSVRNNFLTSVPALLRSGSSGFRNAIDLRRKVFLHFNCIPFVDVWQSTSESDQILIKHRDFGHGFGENIRNSPTCINIVGPTLIRHPQKSDAIRADTSLAGREISCSYDTQQCVAAPTTASGAPSIAPARAVQNIPELEHANGEDSATRYSPQTTSLECTIACVMNKTVVASSGRRILQNPDLLLCPSSGSSVASGTPLQILTIPASEGVWICYIHSSQQFSAGLTCDVASSSCSADPMCDSTRADDPICNPMKIIPSNGRPTINTTAQFFKFIICHPGGNANPNIHSASYNLDPGSTATKCEGRSTSPSPLPTFNGGASSTVEEVKYNDGCQTSALNSRGTCEYSTISDTSVIYIQAPTQSLNKADFFEILDSVDCGRQNQHRFNGDAPGSEFHCPLDMKFMARQSRFRCTCGSDNCCPGP